MIFENNLQLNDLEYDFYVGYDCYFDLNDHSIDLFLPNSNLKYQYFESKCMSSNFEDSFFESNPSSFNSYPYSGDSYYLVFDSTLSSVDSKSSSVDSKSSSVELNAPDFESHEGDVNLEYVSSMFEDMHILSFKNTITS
jgi:hypothetical protein